MKERGERRSERQREREREREREIELWKRREGVGRVGDGGGRQRGGEREEGDAAEISMIVYSALLLMLYYCRYMFIYFSWFI